MLFSYHFTREYSIKRWNSFFINFFIINLRFILLICVCVCLWICSCAMLKWVLMRWSKMIIWIFVINIFLLKCSNVINMFLLLLLLLFFVYALCCSRGSYWWDVRNIQLIRAIWSVTTREFVYTKIKRKLIPFPSNSYINIEIYCISIKKKKERWNFLKINFQFSDGYCWFNLCSHK